MSTNYTIYASNNSGGSWWLTDQDWKVLEKNGWIIDWKEEKWLGATATRAAFEGTLKEAMESFSSSTGQDPYEEGCSCCGPPHYFSGASADEVNYYLRKRGALRLLVMGAEDVLKENKKDGDS
jgi:hypothetical protein